MTTEVKIVKKQIEGIRFNFSSLLLILGCSFLLILSTFVQLNITHMIIPSGIFSSEKLTFADFLYTYKFIPQIPMVMFIGAFLGGGIKYFVEYGFGYILAYIPAVFLSGTILKNGFYNKNLLKATIVGVLTIHVIGLLYMLFIAGLRHEGIAFINGWLVTQSGIKIIYDFIFSFAALFISRYAKIILWFFM